VEPDVDALWCIDIPELVDDVVDVEETISCGGLGLRRTIGPEMHLAFPNLEELRQFRDGKGRFPHLSDDMRVAGSYRSLILMADCCL
jgi:hypothetical protein